METEEIERRFKNQDRRLSDHKRETEETLKAIQSDVAAMKEILETWNSMKGFAAGMRFMSAAIKIVTPIILLIGAAYWFIKTGKLPS